MPSTDKTPDEAVVSYCEKRMEPLSKRLIDIAESLFSHESLADRREFEEHVESRIKNGAKFVPRKKQPR